MIYHLYDHNGRFICPVSKEVWDSYQNPELADYVQNLFEEQLRTPLEDINYNA